MRQIGSSPSYREQPEKLDHTYTKLCLQVSYQGGQDLRAKILERRVGTEISFEAFAHSQEAETLPMFYAKETKIGVHGQKEEEPK